MKLRRLSYGFLIPLLAVTAVVTFWKINKVSFFHHFIRVIAEVEERNSHALLENTPIAVFQLASAETPSSQQVFLTGVQHISSEIILEHHLGDGPETPSCKRAKADIHPVRGP